MPTDATIFAVNSLIKAKKVTFSDFFNDSSMLAIYAGSGTNLEAQNCSFVGWASSNVVRTGLSTFIIPAILSRRSRGVPSVRRGNIHPSISSAWNYRTIPYRNASPFGLLKGRLHPLIPEYVETYNSR